MVFRKGESGNEGGNRGKKVFLDALNAIITQASTGEIPPLPAKSTIAHVMAQRLVKEALAQQKDPKTALAFIQEICDRAYGKPKQAIIGGDEDDEPIRIQTESDEDVIARYNKKEK